MAKAFTEGWEKKFKPITLVIETIEEARDLRNLLGGSTGNPLYTVYIQYTKEYEKQKEVIEDAT